MKLKFGFFPSEVIYYVVIPVAVLLLFGLVYWLVNRKHKDEKYYIFKFNYVCQIIGIMVSIMLFSLLAGYAISTITTIVNLELTSQFYVFIIVISFIPLIN